MKIFKEVSEFLQKGPHIKPFAGMKFQPRVVEINGKPKEISASLTSGKPWFVKREQLGVDAKQRYDQGEIKTLHLVVKPLSTLDDTGASLSLADTGSSTEQQLSSYIAFKESNTSAAANLKQAVPTETTDVDALWAAMKPTTTHPENKETFEAMLDYLGDLARYDIKAVSEVLAVHN